MTDEELEAIERRNEAASEEVDRLCNGGDWTMRIPARPNRDSDLVIGASLADISALLAEVKRLRAWITNPPRPKEIVVELADE
jgi:hypothetical protein